MKREGFNSRTASMPCARKVSVATTRSPSTDSNKLLSPSIAIGSVSQTATVSTNYPFGRSWTDRYLSVKLLEYLRGGRNREISRFRVIQDLPYRHRAQ